MEWKQKIEVDLNNCCVLLHDVEDSNIRMHNALYEYLSILNYIPRQSHQVPTSLTKFDSF